MKIILSKFNLYIVLFLFLLFSVDGNSQCLIASSTNTSTLTCGTSPLSSCGGILYIGDGANAMILTMDANLNLSCLGAIRFIIRNSAAVDFSSGNYDLQLAAGSSIEIEQGGQLTATTNCSASDLIKIGTVNVASCNGGGGGVLTDFPGLVANGGYSSINVTTPSPVCDSGSFTITAAANPSSGATYKWYTTASGDSPVYIGNPYTTGIISATTTYYVEAVYSGYTTVRKPVTATVNTSSVAPTAITGTTTICNGSSTTLTLSGGSAGTGATAKWYTVSCGGTLVGTGNSITVSPTTNTTYYVRYEGACNTTACASTTVTVNTFSAAPTAITGTTTICNGSSTTLTLGGGTAGTGAIAQWYTVSCGGTSVGTGNSITVSPTTNTTYYVRYEGTCNTTTCASSTITVNPNLPASVSISASSSSICSGSSVTFTAIPTNGGTTPTYQWYNGATPISGQTTSTYTSTTLVNSDAIKVVMTSNATPCLTGSPATSNVVTMTVNTPPSAPVVVTTTQPDCKTSTGSVVLNGLPSGSWDLYQDNSGSPIISGVGGSSVTISGLVSGTHHFNVVSGTCLSPQSNDVIISTPPVTNTWNGSWDNGTPTISQALIFDGNYSSAGDVVGCSCQVNSGKMVVFNSGNTLKVTNEVNVVGNGSLTFENNASLVQINDAAVNSGKINYKRTTTPILKTDYTYWSSPVGESSLTTGFTLGEITPSTLYYYFNATANSWVKVSSDTRMVAGKGYIVRGPIEYSTTIPAPLTVTFNEVPNNGVITTGIGGANTSNLIGNPYPSAIDADAFLTENSGVLAGTLYFWTHNTSIRLASQLNNPSTAGSGDYVYTSDDYAAYTITGGTSAVSGGAPHSGKIAAGQGFIAMGYSAGGTATFKNSMRLGSGGVILNNAQFFKLTPTSKASGAIEKNRIWLNLTNTQGAFKQTLVGYITGATNGYDRVYDGVSNNGNKYVDFYSINNNTNLTIQGRAVPFEITDEVPLGYISAIEGEFSINIDNADGLLKDQNVFLEDKVLDTIHDLRLSPYKFTTQKGTFNERFVLAYKDKNASTPDLEILPNRVVVTNKNKELKVISSSEIIDKIFVYDIAGKQLFKKENANNEVFLIGLAPKNQMLLVKVILQNGQVVINKTVY